jgi:hypothetical protein
MFKRRDPISSPLEISKPLSFGALSKSSARVVFPLLDPSEV